jgi:hypothetical protein
VPLPTPRQEFVELRCRVIIDPAENIGKPGFDQLEFQLDELEATAAEASV